MDGQREQGKHRPKAADVCARFLDKDDKPATGVTVSLAPAKCAAPVKVEGAELRPRPGRDAAEHYMSASHRCIFMSPWTMRQW